MYKTPLHELFPKAAFTHHPRKRDAYYVPVSHNEWLELTTSDLTAREQFLLSLLLPEEEKEPTNAWHQFLSFGRGGRPQAIGKLQFVHIRIWNEDVDSEMVGAWLEMMQAFLPLETHFFLHPQEVVFVLRQEPMIESEALFRETLEAVGFDFGVRLTVFVGLVWSAVSDDRLRELFLEERTLVEHWQRRHDRSLVLSFSRLYLWGQGQGLSLSAISDHLKQRIEVEDIAALVLSLWQEGAVLTKAAQKLYLHRNTLQYRLDKWKELTGLNLRDLNDLAFCHSLLAEETF